MHVIRALSILVEECANLLPFHTTQVLSFVPSETSVLTSIMATYVYLTIGCVILYNLLNASELLSPLYTGVCDFCYFIEVSR